MSTSVLRSRPEVSATTPSIPASWAPLGGAAWVGGCTIFVLLVTMPEIGLHALWNVLVPAAPAILVFAPGLWRNVCPLGTTSRIAGRARARFAGTKGTRLPRHAQEWMAVGAVVLFFALVPLRHALFDLDARASAALLALAVLAAVALAWRFEAKSGWCNALCPVHPVELLYGSDPLKTVTNTSCASCTRCVELCPDSVPGSYALAGRRRSPRRIAGILFAGALPGFVTAWFRVPDSRGFESLGQLAGLYAIPLAGGIASLLLFVALRRGLGRSRERALTRFFALAAVTLYYAHRLPALFGAGVIPGDGMLFDLTGRMPHELFTALTLLPVVVFGTWYVAVNGQRRSWSRRPPMESMKHQESMNHRRLFAGYETRELFGTEEA